MRFLAAEPWPSRCSTHLAKLPLRFRPEMFRPHSVDVLSDISRDIEDFGLGSDGFPVKLAKGDDEGLQ